MPVDGHDAVGVFIYHYTVRIHAERPDIVLELLSAVHNLALIELIREMRENHRRQLHSHSDVHTVGAGGNIQVVTDRFHPFAAAPSHGGDAVAAFVFTRIPHHAEAAIFKRYHAADRGVEMEIDMILHSFIQVLKNHVIDVRSQMAD